MMTLQKQFIKAARSAEPAITQAQIARVIGVSRQAVSAGEFNLKTAVERWNNAGRARIVVIPARVELKTPTTEAPTGANIQG